MSGDTLAAPAALNVADKQRLKGERRAAQSIAGVWARSGAKFVNFRFDARSARFHFFWQHEPTFPGRVVWGHATSTDYVRCQCMLGIWTILLLSTFQKPLGNNLCQPPVPSS